MPSQTIRAGGIKYVLKTPAPGTHKQARPPCPACGKRRLSSLTLRSMEEPRLHRECGSCRHIELEPPP